MNKKELLDKIHTLIFCVDYSDKTDDEFMWDIENCVDEYIESTVDPFQAKQLDENIIDITNLLVIGEGFAKTFVRAKQVATMFNVTSKYMFGDFEVLVRENSKFDDIKKLYLEFLYDNNNQF